MNSFYGGRPGNSFVIITTFRSVADMVANFKLGSQYVAVHYDEYVMINTPNKNDPDNGKIYRRGYDFTNELGGAQYIGTIVGPAGKAPMLEIVSRQEVHNKSAEQGFQERKSSGSASVEAGSLVPGKESDDVYNDEISWECCSIRTSNNEDTTAYIGFTLPYPVIEFETEQVQPYYLDVLQDTSYATRTDDRTHPFYSKWKLGIPRGVKGNSSKNVRAVMATQGIVNEDYQGKSNDELNGRQILVCDEYNYDDGPMGNPQTKYIGPYNMISGITLDDDGTLTVNYTHDDPSVYNKKIKWVKSVSIDPDTGVFTTCFNHDYNAQGEQTIVTENLNWVKGIDVDNYGVVTLRYPDSTKDKTLDTKVKWIKNVFIGQDGKVTIQWNTVGQDASFETTDLQTNIKWIENISTAEDGTVNVKYNTESEPTPISKALTYINDVQLENDGHFVFKFNNDTKEDIIIQQPLKWIENTNLNEYGDLTVNYNDGTSETHPKALKWLQNITINPDTGILSFRWNQRNEAGTGKQTSKITLTVPDEGEQNLVYRGFRAFQVAEGEDSQSHLYALYQIKNSGGRTLPWRHMQKQQGSSSYTLVQEDVPGWEDLGPIINSPNLPSVKKVGQTLTFSEQVVMGKIESTIQDGETKWYVDFTIPYCDAISDAVTKITPTAVTTSNKLIFTSNDSRFSGHEQTISAWTFEGTRTANGFHFRGLYPGGSSTLSSPVIITIICTGFTGLLAGS